MKDYLISHIKKLIQKALTIVDDIEVLLTFEDSITAEILNNDIRYHISSGILKLGIRIIHAQKMSSISFMNLNIDEICSIIEQTKNRGAQSLLRNFNHQNVSSDHYHFDDTLNVWAKDGNILKTAQSMSNMLSKHQMFSLIESHEGSLSYHAFTKIVATKSAICSLSRNGIIAHSILNSLREDTKHFFGYENSLSDSLVSFYDTHARSLQKNEISPKEININECMVILHPHVVEDIIRIVAQEKFLASSMSAKTTFLRLNEKIFSDHISIYNNPFIEGWNQTHFDDEQTQTEKFPIVEFGIMKNFLSSRTSALSLNTLSSGNGMRRPVLIEDICEAPVRDSMIGIEIAGGKFSFHEMLSQTKNAIIIYNVLGLHGADISRSAFSTTISDGFAIKNGEIIGSLKPGKWNISGNIFGDTSLFRKVQCSKEQLFTGTALIPYIMTSTAIN